MVALVDCAADPSALLSWCIAADAPLWGRTSYSATDQDSGASEGNTTSTFKSAAFTTVNDWPSLALWIQPLVSSSEPEWATAFKLRTVSRVESATFSYIVAASLVTTPGNGKHSPPGN